MPRTLPFFVVLFLATRLSAQVSMGNGDHVLEISGMISTYYNQRFLKDGETDHKKDRFALRDAQLQFEGRYRNTFEYELQFDIADLAAGTTGGIDPENVGLMDANVTYKGLKCLNVTVGYGKVPYGRSASVPFAYSPYWQRAELVRGDLFSVRDIGVTLTSSLWNDHVTVYGGIYSGLGELALMGDNDASGQPEYVGRVELSYPSRYRKREIDDRISPVPMVSVGISGRREDKSQPDGEVLPSLASGGYGIKVIDGVRTAAGVDVTAQYMGVSAQFEAHRIRLEPRDANSPLYEGVAVADADGHVLAGGYLAQLNYFSKPLRSIFSVRYEELNLSDLAPGIGRRMGGAYAYQLRGFDCMLKVQYWNILEEETTVDALKWTDQVRIGFQYLFN